MTAINRPRSGTETGKPTNQSKSLPRCAAAAEALRNVSYEVLPFASTEQAVLTHVPTEVRLTVTTTETKGLEPSIALAERLASHGYSAAPHLAARLVRDSAHLADIVARLEMAGIDSVFVIGGDAAQPRGPFHDALSLLEAMDRSGHHFQRVGIGGHPEGHAHLSDRSIEQVLKSKIPYATHIVSQMCFNAATTAAWARDVHQHGIDLPILVGAPGAVSRQRLVRISAGLGLGQSARFLRKQQNLFWRFFVPGGYSPDRLIERLVPSLKADDNGIQGIHLFTFNELEKTEAWRRTRLARLS